MSALHPDRWHALTYKMECEDACAHRRRCAFCRACECPHRDMWARCILVTSWVIWCEHVVFRYSLCIVLGLNEKAPFLNASRGFIKSDEARVVH